MNKRGCVARLCLGKTLEEEKTTTCRLAQNHLKLAEKLSTVNTFYWGYDTSLWQTKEPLCSKTGTDPTDLLKKCLLFFTALILWYLGGTGSSTDLLG
jgi:hypothetical protein